MKSHHEAYVVAPDWLVPVESPPIHLGLLVIQGGNIEFVGRELPSKYSSLPLHRLAGYAILPGLINAHCHLEFSDLDQPISAAGSFPDWIRSVIAHRSGMASTNETLFESRKAAFIAGIKESYASGVRCLVDMTTAPWDSHWIKEGLEQSLALLPNAGCFAPQVPMTVIPCAELIDISEARKAQTVGFFEKQKDAPKFAGQGRFGLAPHASYTASAELTAWAGKVSQLELRLATMHLAESDDEIQWLRDQSGPFSKFLGPMVSAAYFQSLGSINDRLQALIPSWRALVAHGNYLGVQEFELLAQHRSSMAIVHCPRTHQHFRHQHVEANCYPMRERTSTGVRHFLGTDSRASNPDLNLWREAQWLKSNHPSMSSFEILKMITTDAARFLDLSRNEFGFVEQGSMAGLTAVSSSRQAQNSLYDDLLRNSSQACPMESLLGKTYRKID